MAENLLASQHHPQYGEIDPEIVDGALLAHDLGHPPFGHIAEVELDRLLLSSEVIDGYEGNAQSFRILTKLSAHRQDYDGLNLSRAMLNGVLKYPWFRQASGKKRHKWGAYHSESAEFEFARAEHNHHNRGFDNTGIEAAIMTWADDIAYAVHDSEDFYRAGLIPLEKLLGPLRPGTPSPSNEVEAFLERSFARWKEEGIERDFSNDDLRTAFLELARWLPPISEAYRGTHEQRVKLRTWTSKLIGRYVIGTELAEPGTSDSYFSISPQFRMEITMLKELTWHYVIKNPSLACQQHGQRTVIRTLFEIYADAWKSGKKRWSIFPPCMHDALTDLASKYREIPDEVGFRVVADTIAWMTDHQALQMYNRLAGVLPGSVLDPILR